MSFSNLMRDKIRIKKGDIYSDYMQASVSSENITTFDTSFNIEEGDIVERYFGDNIEYYEVIDRGFHSGSSRIPANYQMKVRRKNSVQATPSVINTYNISNVDKVNIQSTDNSVNIKTETPSDLIDKLLELSKQLNDINIEEAIKELGKNIGKKTFFDKYCSFIQVAANHMSVFAPFIPDLTQLLQQYIK